MSGPVPPFPWRPVLPMQPLCIWLVGPESICGYSTAGVSISAPAGMYPFAFSAPAVLAPHGVATSRHSHCLVARLFSTASKLTWHTSGFGLAVWDLRSVHGATCVAMSGTVQTLVTSRSAPGFTGRTCQRPSGLCI